MKPWLPSKYKKADAAAVQALTSGKATPEQQQRAIKYIVETLCGTYDMTYHPESDRDTTLAEGKRWVGLQIVKLTKLNLSKIKDDE